MPEKNPLSERIAEFVIYRFRWVFVILFLLPLSVIYDMYFSLRCYIIFKIRAWKEAGKRTKMCNARSGWASMSFRFPLYKNTLTRISTDTLVDILQVNTSAKTVRVEPMVTMGQLTKYLIPLGFTLPIVPELDDLTVGGMINGCGVESSGRRYGLFQHICFSYEIVTAEGELIVADKDKDSEPEVKGLFYCIPWSHGTLGFLVAATLRIVPCKPFVKLSYFPVHSFQEMDKVLYDVTEVYENEFVEAIQFSRNSGVVMIGRFCAEPPRNGIVNPIGRWYTPWFYTHAEGIAAKNEERTEYIPLRHYYHRHSKSIFWELKEIIPFGNNFLFRWLLGWACPPKISLLKYTTPAVLRRIYDRNHVLQDLLIPQKKIYEALELLDREVSVYPIWLCPFRMPTCPGIFKQRSGGTVSFVDVGVYGVTKVPGYNARETTRRVEKYVREVGGAQMLYADTYMTREEFWEMFDSSLYQWLRIKHNAISAFPDVYDKVCREARY